MTAHSAMHPGDFPAPRRAAAARLGMWVFIGSEVLFFGGLMLAYLYGRTHWPHGFALASRRTDVVLGTLNTALLLTSSAVIALAVHKRQAITPLLWITVALGAAFLVVKGMEYHHEFTEHLFPGDGFALAATTGAELFFMLYFVTTALHALHLLAGMGGVSVLAWRRLRCIEPMALYWHFVDVVWIFLYPLLYLVERHS
jgi:cytochrome c oxidase subunit 3